MLEVFQYCDAYPPWKNPAQYAASVLMSLGQFLGAAHLGNNQFASSVCYA
jgi:hypothetical protein